MKRTLVVSFLALFSLGCQGCQTPSPTLDPFLGRTTVPPPPTGVVGPAAVGSTPDSGGFLQRSPPTVPGTNNQFTPPESRNDLYTPPGMNSAPPVGAYPGYQSSKDPPAGAPSATFRAVAEASEPPAESGVQQASFNNEIRIVEPSPAASSATSNISTVPITAGPNDIMNLPPKNSSGGVSSSTMSDRRTLRPVIGTGYSHDPQYSRLSGRLEYSQVERQWKLRYIPIDGNTDRYGGSVVLDSSQVQGFAPDDFVSVRGQVSARAHSGSFSPVYEVAQIEPLRE